MLSIASRAVFIKAKLRQKSQLSYYKILFANLMSRRLLNLAALALDFKFYRVKFKERAAKIYDRMPAARTREAVRR